MQTLFAQTDPGRQLLEAYLPRTLAERWAQEPSADPIWGVTLEGTLMHVDMSGFTAMSERLARLGKEGAELMAAVLNRFFDRMLHIADGWGGLQMKFGGDAMLLFFDAEDHAMRAAACALEMQRAMPEFRAVTAGGEAHRLRMRAGIHSGRFFSASAGDPDGVLHYLLIGPDVSRTAATEAAGEPGMVVVSAETAALLRGRARLTAKGDVWRVRAIDDVARPGPRADIARAPSSILKQYLMRALATRLVDSETTRFAAEHRRVTAIFVNVLGVAELLECSSGEEGALREVDAYLKILLRGLSRHGGFLAGSDASDHGDKLIVLFGAPVSTERDEASALRFVLDLDAEVKASGLALRHSIGVSTGFVFAGEIGSSIRREYTVIGDSVNLSARLMTAAPTGQIYVSDVTASRAGSGFSMSTLRPMAVKGKAQRVQAFRLKGAVSEDTPPADAMVRAPLLGRDREIGEVMALAEEVSRSGDARLAFIFGEPGIGKSAFVAETMSRLVSVGWQRFVAQGYAHRSVDVFAAWHEPLRAIFAIQHADDDQVAYRKIELTVGELVPEQLTFAPLIAELLSITAEEGPLLRFLDARTRRQHLTTILRGVISAVAHRAPMLLVFEDAHFCDEPSLELLAELTHGLQAPVFAWVTSRSSLPPDPLREPDPALSLELIELDAASARQLAASLATVDDRRLDDLLARAHGNPLFVEQLAMSSGQSEMPETVNDVIVARLDRLPPEQKSVLAAAAIVGSSFDVGHVRSLLPERLDDEALFRSLAGLDHAGFTVGAEDTRAFRHPLTQEVLYDTLPFVQRRELHGVLARQIERESSTHLDMAAGLLLHHFGRAGDAPKTVVYAALSGDRAARAYANREAIDDYTRGLTALEATGDGSQSDRSVLLERIGQCLETQGRHGAASEALLDALERWRHRAGSRRRRLLNFDVPESARESALCRRIAVSFERSSAYDDALKWLDAALAALPARSGRTGAEVFASRSVTLYRKGEYRDAIDWGRRALAAARRLDDPGVVAYAENMLAQSYMAEGSLREAVRHLTQAVRAYTQIGDTPGQAAAHNNLGSCYQLLGMLDAARRHYETALEADARVGDHVDMAIIHNNIGEIMLLQGKYDEAIASLESVLEAHRLEEELTAVAGLSYVNLSRCALAQGDLHMADQYVRNGMRLLRRVGAKGLLTEARMQRAKVMIARRDLAGALREGTRALNDAQKSGDRLLEARGERIVGMTRAAMGAVDTAAIRLATSAGLARRIGAGHEEARSLLALSRLRVNTGGRPRTTGLRRALSIFTRMGAAPDIAEAERVLAAFDGAA